MVAQIKQGTGAQPAVADRYSVEHYFDLELASEIRHEFRDGEIIPMTGGTPNHNRIIRNLCILLAMGARGSTFEVFVTDQRLWIPKKRLHTYPDILVIDGELQFESGRKDTVINPVLIVEVLSESTQDYDRGDKFKAYRTIPSFKEYVLVNQYRQSIEHFVKTSAREWTFRDYDDTDPSIQLLTLDLEIAIAEIYDTVQLERPDSNATPTDCP